MLHCMCFWSVSRQRGFELPWFSLGDNFTDRNIDTVIGLDIFRYLHIAMGFLITFLDFLLLGSCQQTSNDHFYPTVNDQVHLRQLVTVSCEDCLKCRLVSIYLLLTIVLHRTKTSRITALSLQSQLRKRKNAFKTDTIEGVNRLPARRVTSHTLHNHELQTLSRWSMASLRS